MKIKILNNKDLRGSHHFGYDFNCEITTQNGKTLLTECFASNQGWISLSQRGDGFVEEHLQENEEVNCFDFKDVPKFWLAE